jgi:hypothetical protein
MTTGDLGRHIKTGKFRYTDDPEKIASRVYRDVERFLSTGQAEPEVMALIGYVFNSASPFDVALTIRFVAGLLDAKERDLRDRQGGDDE